MNSFARKLFIVGIAAALVVLCWGAPAFAGAHTWRSWSVFTNAAGNVQFVILKEALGGPAEVNLQLHSMISHPSNNSKTMHIVNGNTALTSYLLATADFAALPGAPVPDDIIPNNFVVVATDSSMEYSGTDTASWTAGTLPTNGINMYSRLVNGGPMTSVPNVATNFAGVTYCVDASGVAPPALPGVPDGTTGAPMTVGKVAGDPTSLTISFDTSLCTDTSDHQIVFGQKNGFPAKRGGLYTTTGGKCGIGPASPYTWNGIPTATDVIENSRLTWFLVVTTDGAGTEGPWGTWNGVNDRNGTGARCSSNQCGTIAKTITGSACGH